MAGEDENSESSFDIRSGDLVIRRLKRMPPDRLAALEEYGRAALDDSALNRWMLPVVATWGLLYVGLLDNEIVGAAEIIRCMTGSDLYLEGFYIRPEFQGRGFGSALLAGLSRKFSSDGFNRLICTVDPQNGAGLHLYQKTGFQEIDYLPDHYGPGRHRLVLSLDLSGVENDSTGG